MRCSRVQEDMSRYLLGEGNSMARAALAEHLGACPVCTARMAELRRLNDLLDLWQPEPAPDDFRATLMLEVATRFSREGEVQHRQQLAQAAPIRTVELLRHLAVAVALALVLSWGIVPWLAGPQALAVTGADRLVHSYTIASDSVLQDTVIIIESLTIKLNFEELISR